MSATLSDARTWNAIAPIDSSASPIAAAIPIGAHSRPDEHAGDAGEFARADEPPLQRLDPEVVADRQGLGDAEQFDARGEGEERRKQDRHDYGGGVHHRAG